MLGFCKQGKCSRPVLNTHGLLLLLLFFSSCRAPNRTPHLNVLSREVPCHIGLAPYTRVLLADFAARVCSSPGFPHCPPGLPGPFLQRSGPSPFCWQGIGIPVQDVMFVHGEVPTVSIHPFLQSALVCVISSPALKQINCSPQLGVIHNLMSLKNVHHHCEEVLMGASIQLMLSHFLLAYR